MKIAIDGRLPREFGVSRAELARIAGRFAGWSGMRTGEAFADVSIILQCDAESAEVHEAINGAEGPTDVITQRYDPMPGEAVGVHGELYVNTDRALAAARKGRGWSQLKELLLYVAHGMDHLSGADDLDERGYRSMRRRELSWVRKAVKLN